MTDMTTGAELRAPTARGRAPGGDRLSVLVRIDLDGRHVTLVVTGPLTGTSQKALAPLAVRARALFPGSDLTVDLHEALEAEPAAVDLLRWSLDEVQPVTGPVRITALVPSRDQQPVGFPAGGTP
ncbi:UNVERIFIED_CONTAM: hypothetical protein RF653_10295 [Kocuria sp. CPCC 205316]|uniref:hypothetical protein n=1 Tax=Kocuria TaxID=57493 RepID=UPI0036DE3103